jgi:Holliday junction resolvase RusA-like endonuclease
MDRLAFVVAGEPVPKGRARTRVMTTKAGKSFAHHFTPAETRAFEERVALMCQAAVARVRWGWGPKDRFAVSIHVFRTHEGKGGDADNYLKACLDAVNGIAFADDRYVRKLEALLAQDPERPRVEVEIRRMRIGEMAA